jgi:hypothetical protein
MKQRYCGPSHSLWLSQLDQRTIDEIDQAVRQNVPQQLENPALPGPI